MSTRPRVQLRLVTPTQPNPIVPDDVDDQPKKRGRPKKIAEENPTEMVEDPESLKKKGRKKKPEMVIADPLSTSSVITSSSKSFIVQLKVKSTDLEKVQSAFMNKSQNIGYKPPSTQEINSEKPETNFDEYYKLLNNLEMPLVPVTNLTDKLNMVYGQSFKNTLPTLPQVYPYTAISVMPNRVPVRLFDEDLHNPEESLNGDHHHAGEMRPKAFRNTTNLILPQFNQNGGQWIKSSPYPCWNCDIYFDGTPIGLIDHESNGKFYCYGNCCDFPCAARYMADRESPSDFWIKYSLLCLLYQKAYGLSPEHKVTLALPRESLSKYGGKLSYDEYHLAHKTDRKVEIYKLPLIPVMLHIEELSKTMNIERLIVNNNQAKGQKNAPAKAKKVERSIPIDPQQYNRAVENIRQKQQERIQSKITLDSVLSKPQS